MCKQEFSYSDDMLSVSGCMDLVFLDVGYDTMADILSACFVSEDRQTSSDVLSGSSPGGPPTVSTSSTDRGSRCHSKYVKKMLFLLEWWYEWFDSFVD